VRRAIGLIVLAALVTACGDLAASTSVGAAPTPCEIAQRNDAQLGPARLVARFSLTAAELVAWEESPSRGSHAGFGWGPARSLDPTAPVFVCFFDGQFTFRGPLPPGATEPTATRSRVIIAADGSVIEQQGGSEASLPLMAPVVPSPWPTLDTRPPGPLLIVASRTTPIASSEIADLLTRAGVPSHIAARGPARVLYGASDVDVLSVDDPGIAGAAIYRYSTVARARDALRLDVVQNPARGTVLFMARPYFIALGDTLVSIAATDENVAMKMITALQLP
jgi:hypothetical protein